MAAGPARDVLKDDLLSAAYGCRVLTNRTPGEGQALRPAAGHLPSLDRVRPMSGDADSAACSVSGTEIPSNTFAFELTY